MNYGNAMYTVLNMLLKHWKNGRISTDPDSCVVYTPLSLAARAAVVEDRVLGETVPEGLGDVLPDARGVDIPTVKQAIIIFFGMNIIFNRQEVFNNLSQQLWYNCWHSLASNKA